MQTISINKQLLVDYAKGYALAEMVGVIIEEEKLVLDKGKNIGFYTSSVFECPKFKELVGSWSCITTTDATIELLVRVRTNGVWSKYFSYGEWGLGKENFYINQDDVFSKMDIDEIILKDNFIADAFQYQTILKKTKNESPKLSLVAITINTVEYSEVIDTTDLPKEVKYDVPKVNQNIVPVIGHEICSPTTITMLLKYKGMDFSSNDEFENRHIAKLVADPGHNSPTYGNWVYNTAVAGAFGFNAYVARLSGWDALKQHLSKVGPVGASIKGDTGIYKTNGHLIAVVGYKETDKGTFVLCNDPNINERFGKDLFVYYEYPLDVFINFWRKVIYVIE